MLTFITGLMALAITAAAEESKKFTDFTVEELSDMTIWQRFKLQNWNLELITVAFTVSFVLLYKVGDIYNQSIVTKYLKGLNEVFTANFFQYGTSATDLYVKDSAENFSSYATGRENIASVKIDFKLQPRHNVFVWILETVMSFFMESVRKPFDRVDIVITPSVEYDNFIQAIVSKLGMNDLRKFNYFLSLTRTLDSTDIPESFVYMTEVNEIQEKISTAELRQALTVPAAGFLKFISFTDQAIERPESLKELIPKRRIILSTELTTSKTELAQLSEILAAVFSIVDKLATKEIEFKPETLRKVVKTREVEVSKIKKLIEEVKEADLAEEKAKLKQQEREKFRQLSREEQIKAEKKALEKKQKKQQKKQRLRM